MPIAMLLQANMKTILLLLLCTSFLAIPVNSLTDPLVPHIFFPFGADVGDDVVPVGDSMSSPAISVSTGSFPYLFGNYSTVFVSTQTSLAQYFIVTYLTT